MPAENSAIIQTVRGIDHANGRHLLFGDVYESNNLNTGDKICGDTECSFAIPGTNGRAEIDLLHVNPIPNVFALHYGTDDLVGHNSRITREEEFGGALLAIENLIGTVSHSGGNTPIEFERQISILEDYNQSIH